LFPSIVPPMQINRSSLSGIVHVTRMQVPPKAVYIRAELTIRNLYLNDMLSVGNS